MTRSQIYKDITLEMNKQYFVELVQAAGFYSIKAMANRSGVWIQALQNSRMSNITGQTHGILQQGRWLFYQW